MQRVVKLGRNTDGMPFGGFLDWDREGFGSRIHVMTMIHSDSDYVIIVFLRAMLVFVPRSPLLNGSKPHSGS